MNDYFNLGKERGMKRIVKSMFVAVMMFGMLATSFRNPLPAFASVPTGEFRGRTTNIHVSSIEDGELITIQYDLYIDPTYDFFEACNTTIVYDAEIFEFESVRSSVSGVFVLADEMSHIDPGQYNIMLANWDEKPMQADGFAFTVIITLQIIDAEKLIAAKGSSIEIGLWKNDFAVSKDGVIYDYDDYVKGYLLTEMDVTFSDMKVVVTGLPTPTAVQLSVIADATVKKGETHQFAVTVTGATDPSVAWTVRGATSTNTTINPITGLLTVGDDETAATLVVTATSNEDSTKISSATVTVVNAGTTHPPVINPGNSTNPVPNTGVEGSILPWMGLMAVAAGASTILLKKKKESEVE